MNAMVRRLQPHIIINDRSRLPEDFATVEQHLSRVQAGRPWEFCMTMNANWGYARRSPYKSSAELIRTLILVVSRGGNLLLNVGPKADGSFPRESVKRLKEIGSWMRVNGESIYGCGAHPISWTSFGNVTAKENAVYFHLLKCWTGGDCVLPGLKNRVRSAKLLGSKARLKVKQDGARMFVSGLPKRPPDKLGSVIKIVTDGKPEMIPYPQ